MTKQFLFFLFLSSISFQIFSQNGNVKGNVKDSKTGEALIGASVYVEGTTIGTVTDFDGNYILNNIPTGNVNIKCSFISYQTASKNNITIKNKTVAVVNFTLGESTVKLNDVKVVAKANRESEVVLLIDQKKAIGIQQSIGAQELASQGVSDAATAASKISGVTKNENSGDVYIRGLGDRYLSSTMNGLPIPSDDVENKNIDLNLFSTDIIKNISINKTFAVDNFADQSSGNVNISSKTFSDRIAIRLTAKSNTNILKSGIFNNFKSTQNSKSLNFGFYNKNQNKLSAVQNQSWNTQKRDFPLGYDFSLVYGKKVKLFKNDFSFFASLSLENEANYQKGIYKKYRSNVLDQSFSDVENFQTKVSTNALVNLNYQLNENHSFNINSVWIHKTKDQLYEQGRNGKAYVFDQDPQEDGAFVRDQNTKETNLIISQLLGSHRINDRLKSNWAIAYNQVKAEEPNRIRNEVNILDKNTVQFAHVGDFQQRKSSQNIKDSEINGYLKNEFQWIDQNSKNLKLNIGGNFRSKKRDFNSLFIGVRAKGIQVVSIDNLDEALLNTNLYNSKQLIIRERNPDLYDAKLKVYAGYISSDFQLNKFSGNIGFRYENNEIEVNWDVANYVGRTGNISNQYGNILPSLQLKYQFNEKNTFRFSGSKTITLPEFKELAPFEYVSPTGRVTKGNPDLKNSENYNFDLKWEFFPSAKQLISASAFYKIINDPINLAQSRGSSGNFIYENTGKKADVYGLELEGRFHLLKAKNSEEPEINLILNTTKMWFKQDLLKEFQYNNKTESDLQGASDFIVNGTVSFSTNKKNNLKLAISGNYSSDKILALGSPEDFSNSGTLFNSEIIEKGFVKLDFVLSKKLSKRFAIKLAAKNLLNPKIEQTQKIKPLSGKAFNEVVNSYKKGVDLSCTLKINLN